MRFRLLSALVAFVCAAGTADAQFAARTGNNSPENYHLEAGLMLWKPAPDIILSSGTLSTPIDFVNTFPIDKKRFPEVRLTLKAGKHKIRFSNENLNYSGTAPLTERIRFQGQTFDVGVPTTADLKWRLMRVGYEYDPVATSKGFFGIFTDVKLNTLNATLSAPSIAASESFQRDVPVPTIGIIGRGYATDYVSITGEFTGFTYDHKNFDAHSYDLDIYGTANFGRFVGAQVGYRSLTTKYDIDTDAGDMKMKGLYFGGLIRF